MVQVVDASAAEAAAQNGENSGAVVAKKKQRRGKRKSKTADAFVPPPPPGFPDGDHPADNVDDVDADGAVQEQAYFGHVPEETLAYFKSIEQLLTNADDDQDAVDDIEARQNLVQNVYAEVDGKELVLATDSSCSRTLEKLVRQSDEFAVRVLLDRFVGNYCALCTHRFASHVMQTLLSSAGAFIAASAGGNEDSVDQQKEGSLLSTRRLFVNLCAELSPHWTRLMTDAYGSHLLRTILQVLSGGRARGDAADRDLTRSRASLKYNTAHKLGGVDQPLIIIPDEPSEEFSAALRDIVDQLLVQMSDVELRSFSCHAVANPVLQTLLRLFRHDADTSDRLISRILMDINSSEADNAARTNYIGALLKSPVGSHLMETMLNVSQPQMLQTIVVKCFLGRLVELSFDPVANYAVQCLLGLSRLPDEILSQIYTELSNDLARLLFRGRANVVLKLMEVVRMRQLPNDFSTVIQSAFQLDSDQRRKLALNCMLCLQTASDYEKEPGRIQVAGSRLVQEVLKCADCAFMVGSFLAQQVDRHTDLLSNSAASHVYEAFMQSSSVDQRIKRRLIKCMTGRFAQLAMDRCGSHFVDKCWPVADTQLKVAIGDELVLSYAALTSSTTGRIILRNLNMDLFRRNRAEWALRQQSGERKKRMFDDILSDHPPVKGKGFTKPGAKHTDKVDVTKENSLAKTEAPDVKIKSQTEKKPDGNVTKKLKKAKAPKETK